MVYRVLHDSWCGNDLGDNFVNIESEVIRIHGVPIGTRLISSKFWRHIIRPMMFVAYSSKFDAILVHFSQKGNKLIFIMMTILRRRNIIILEMIYNQNKKGLFHRSIYPIAKWAVIRPTLNRTVMSAQVMTAWEREHYSHMFGIPIDRIRHISWPIGASRVSAAAKLGDRHGVFSSGRAACDWETLFSAAKGRDWDLTVVCSSKDYPRVKRLAADVEKSRVYTEISPEEHFNMLRNSTVCVICLLDEKGSSGQVRLGEAISLGIPVVATDIPGLDGYLIDGITALSAKVGDSMDLRLKVEGLLGSDYARYYLADKAKAHTTEMSVAAYLQRIKEFIEFTLQNGCKG